MASRLCPYCADSGSRLVEREVGGAAGHGCPECGAWWNDAFPSARPPLQPEVEDAV